jgi:hypothetical protein
MVECPLLVGLVRRARLDRRLRAFDGLLVEVTAWHEPPVELFATPNPAHAITPE